MNLKQLLADRGIVCAHIVDDAFDEKPSYPLTAEQAQHVLDVADDEGLNAICSILGLAEGDEDGVRAALQIVDEVHKLFARRCELLGAVSHAVFDPFDKDREGKQSELKPLLALLEENGIKYHCFGVDYDPSSVEEPQLLFVDLKLKEGPGEMPRHEDAVKIYKALNVVRQGCRPFVFLMSSLTLALGSKREGFRRDAELFQSEFEDVDKAIFKNGDEFSRVLASYTTSMPQLKTLRDSMRQVEVAVQDAVHNVMEELRALDLADYFVLYNNTTSVEKVELGSYVVEMLLEFLAHEVEGREQIWKFAEAIGGLDVKKLPRARFGITQAAAQLYSANMLHSPAMLRAEDGMEHGPAQGYFFTGDVFFDAHSLNLATPERAYAIVTPACDLVRPDKLVGKSIFLCEGSVKEMTPGAALIAADGLPLVVMEHPRVQGRYVVIEWHKKKLHVWNDLERGKFGNPAECSYVRVGRLRPVYALQLQHAVTADLSRVGTQKPPSALIPHGLKCFASDGTKWSEIYSDGNSDAAALSDFKNGDKKYTTYVLSDPSIHKAMVRLSSWLDEHKDVPARASIEKLLGDDARETLRGVKQKVPEKAQNGKALDVTCYPFSDAWKGAESKVVALVRGVGCPSPYSQIADGHAVKGDQDAKVVFRLEAASVPEEHDEEASAEAE
jgi:hypothetical protein